MRVRQRGAAVLKGITAMAMSERPNVHLVGRIVKHDTQEGQPKLTIKVLKREIDANRVKVLPSRRGACDQI